MTLPMSLAQAAQRALRTTTPDFSDPAAFRGQTRPQLRRYEVSTLMPDGNVAMTRHLAPATPFFEDAFCAFSRGTLIATDTGPIAIEDLLPGDRVMTSDGKAEELVWKGTTTLVPSRPGPSGRNMKLTRITADAFGIERPYSCVVAGPSARLLNTPRHLRGAADAQMLTGIQEFIDGNMIIETAPPTAVELFHICLRRHATIRIAGLEFETYHPGENAPRMIGSQLRELYFSLFSHVDSFADFGPLAHPRQSDETSTALSA